MISGRGILGFLLVLVVAGVCVRAGYWQLDRLEQRRASNAQIAVAMTLPPLRLDADAVGALLRDPGAFAYRHAVAEGTFRPGTEIVIRGRSRGGSPGVHLVVPLEVVPGVEILVNRGWIPSLDGTTVDPRPLRPAGPVRVEGILQPLPPVETDPAPVAIELDDTTITTYRRLPEPGSMGLRTELPPVYLQVLPAADAPAVPPIPLPPPSLDEGPHLGYALQWFSFAAIAIIGFIVVVRIRRKAVQKGTPQGV